MKIKKINQSVGYIGSIVDSLENESQMDALSARQGKILNNSIIENTEKIDNIENIINTLEEEKLDKAGGTITGDLKAKSLNAYFLGAVHPATWTYIGDIEFSAQGQYAIIDCYSGNGQNGNPYQNTHFQILITQGWKDEDLPIGITCRFEQNYSSSFRIIIKQDTKMKCKLYIYLPFNYTDLTYIINGSYINFTALNTSVEEEPDFDKEATIYWIADDTITFTISGTTYTARRGMTWSEWCKDTTYNPDGFYTGISTDSVYNGDGVMWVGYLPSSSSDYSPVKRAGCIIANEAYTLRK